ncbi:MAG: hypothetical protein AAGB32_05945 [Pseudomonadota bacterium]
MRTTSPAFLAAAATILSLSLAPDFAQAQTNNCGSADRVSQKLSGEYKEGVVFSGLINSKTLFEYWQNDQTGSWTATATGINDQTCIIASGGGSFFTTDFLVGLSKVDKREKSPVEPSTWMPPCVFSRDATLEIHSSRGMTPLIRAFRRSNITEVFYNEKSNEFTFVQSNPAMACIGVRGNDGTPMGSLILDKA